MILPNVDFVALTHAWLAALYRASWQGAIAIGLVWCLCRFMPRLSASARCWLWRLVLVKFLLVILWPGSIDLPWLPVGHGPAYAYVPANGPLEPAGLPDTTASPQTEFANADHPALSVSTNVWRITFHSVLAPAWVSGVVVVTAILIARSRAARRWRKQCVMVKDADVLSLCEALSGELGVYQPPVLFASDACEGPVVFGALRTSVVLPARLLDHADLPRLRLILRHELAHIRRGDLVWNWVATVVWGLFFFHPLVWLALRELRLNQELACDACAIEPKDASLADYGALLLELADRARAPSNMLVTVGVVESFEFLKRRLTAMRNVREHSRWAGGMSVALVSLAIVGLLPWRLVARSPQTAPAVTSATSATQTPIAAPPQGTPARVGQPQPTPFKVTVTKVVRFDEKTGSRMRMVPDGFPIDTDYGTAGRTGPVPGGNFSITGGSVSAYGSSAGSGAAANTYGSSAASTGHSHTESSWSGTAVVSGSGSGHASGYGGSHASGGGSAIHSPAAGVPNCAVVLQVTGSGQAICTLLGSVTAEDDRGNPVLGPPTPPRFKLELPGVDYPRTSGYAAVLLRIAEQTAKRLKSLAGELLVIEAKVQTIAFDGSELQKASTHQLDGVTVRLDEVHSTTGALRIDVSISRPPATGDRMADLRRLSEVGTRLHVEVLDSSGSLRRSHGMSSSGSSDPMVPYSFQFAPLPQGVTVKKVICVVTDVLGKPQRIAFALKDVPLP